MNFLNRLRVIAFALFFIVTLTGVLVFPGGVAGLMQRLADQESGIRLIMVLAALSTDVILGWIVYREVQLIRQRAPGASIRTRAADAHVTTDAIRLAIIEQVTALEGIELTTASVSDERGRVNVRVQVLGVSNLDIRKATKSVIREVEKVVEKQMGLRFSRKPIIEFDLQPAPPSVTTQTTSTPQTADPLPAKDAPVMETVSEAPSAPAPLDKPPTETEHTRPPFGMPKPRSSKPPEPKDE